MSRKYLNGISTNALQVGTSATAGYVLTADASGNATFQAGGAGGSGITRSILSISTATTAPAIVKTDYVYFVSGTTTLTLPTAVSNTNMYSVTNADASLTTTVTTTSSQTINGSITITLVPGQSVDLISNNTNWGIF